MNRMSPFVCVGGLLLTCAILLLVPEERLGIVAPACVALYAYFAFAYLLHRRVGDNILGEIGFLFLSFAIAYTVLPALTFAVGDLDSATGVWEYLAQLLPDPAELSDHLWRHVLFIVGVGTGYLLLRKPMPQAAPIVPESEPEDRIVLILLLAITLTSVLAVATFSAPVESYIDHYTRFDHLSAPLRLLVHVFLTLKTSAYYILLALLFRDFRKNKLKIAVAVVAIAAYETTYSFGSRIETLSIILATVCLYHYSARRISLKAGALAFLAIAVLFSALELFRSLEFNLSDARGVVATEGARPAAEFGSVFFTGFHLYGERAQGSLPPTDALMLVNDLLALIPFVDHFQWNPMYWYARHYYPDAAVPPLTMGPIADSAIWGGEIDLFFRALLIGLWYAALMHWYLARRRLWWATVIYAYLYATCVMTLKYSVFYQLAPLLKVVMPGIALVWVLKRAMRAFSSVRRVVASS